MKNRDIKELDLTTYAYNELKEHGINFISEIPDSKELLDNNFTIATVFEIDCKLREL